LRRALPCPLARPPARLWSALSEERATASDFVCHCQPQPLCAVPLAPSAISSTTSPRPEGGGALWLWREGDSCPVSTTSLQAMKTAHRSSSLPPSLSSSPRSTPLLFREIKMMDHTMDLPRRGETDRQISSHAQVIAAAPSGEPRRV
jgi:hypothetical protein